jgi:hypothetical protein
MIGRSGRRRGAVAGTPVSGLAPGCLFATVSTLATCLLLFVNGGLVAAICSAASRSGVSILSNTGVHQFFLFVGPVVLVVIQWMMIDYVTSRIRRGPS